MASEKSPLLSRVTFDEPSFEEHTNADSHRMHHYAVNNNDDIVMVDMPSTPPRKTRTLTADSVSSAYDPFTTGNGSEDIQELLKNLEKATSLVKRHVTLNQELEEPRQRKSRALIPYWLTKYLLIITFLWQASNLGILEVIYRVTAHNSTLEHDVSLASNVIMVVFQFVHLILVFFISVKLVKQVIHRSASGSLLAQSYLSTVLLFAGLYTLEYRLDVGAGWVIGTKNNEYISEPLYLFLRMSYLSVSTATLCGTSQVEPTTWYASATVSLQMLASFVYFASILSLGVVERKKSKYDPPPGRWGSLTGKIRRCIFRTDD